MLCPEDAAVLAALKKEIASGRISKSARVLLFNCATGLKYPLPKAGRQLDIRQPIDYDALLQNG